MSCYDTYVTNEGLKRCSPDQLCPDCRIGELEQRILSLETLLQEVLNEVPHGWGASFSDSELAASIREMLE